MPLDASQVLEREFLELRAKILELGASLDRLDRSTGTVGEDPRVALLRRGIDILKSPEEGRAERIQLLFSLDYDPSWRENLGFPAD